MKYAAAHNVTDQPVTIDDEGHEIPGGMWGEVRHQTHRIRTLVDAGKVNVLPSLTDFPQMRPDARAALERVRELNAEGTDDDVDAPTDDTADNEEG